MVAFCRFKQNIRRLTESDWRHCRLTWTSTPKTPSSRVSRSPRPLVSWRRSGKFTAWWRTTPTPGSSTRSSSEICARLLAVTAGAWRPSQSRGASLGLICLPMGLCVNAPPMLSLPLTASGSAPECKFCTQIESWKKKTKKKSKRGSLFFFLTILWLQ